MHKYFSKCSGVNSDFSCVKVIKLVNKYSLVSMTQFWHPVDLFCNRGIYHWRQIFMPLNITTLNVLHLAKKENDRFTVANCSTSRLLSKKLSHTICDWSACWSVADAQYWQDQVVNWYSSSSVISMSLWKF